MTREIRIALPRGLTVGETVWADPYGEITILGVGEIADATQRMYLGQVDVPTPEEAADAWGAEREDRLTAMDARRAEED